MEDLFQKFKKQFIEEILGLLEQLENDLLVLEKDPENREVIDSIFRAMHTIKGTSGMYGCMFISDFTHHFENIYQNLRDTNSNADKTIIDISLASLDLLRKLLLEDENLEDPENKRNHDELLKRIDDYFANIPVIDKNNSLSAIQLPEKDVAEITRTWYILIRTNEQIFFRGINLVNVLTDLSTLGTFHIHRIPSLSDLETETWGIVLISSAKLTDIKEVFMFIEDICTFSLIKEGDLLNPEPQAQQSYNVSNVNSKKETTQNGKLFVDSEPVVKKERKAEKPDDVIADKKELKTALLLNTAVKYNTKRINVDSSKLDYLMYLVSELITLNSQLLQTTKDDYYEPIRPQIEQMESLVKLFRNNALEIRLVPLNDLILKFQRLIRDLSGQLNKKIAFTTQGTDIEMDKNTIDLIAEPIIHIIRNCIDHGIESPEERLKKGKPESGTVKLSASHVGNYIHIRIEDDGKGLDLNKIRDKAIQSKLIKSTDNLSKKDLTDLIFSSGISTAKSITSISGRGVGMDAVRRSITELRGEIEVDTEDDKGTVFILKIQQSVAIIDTLLFRVENTYFITPLTEIEICIHTDFAELIKNQNTGTIEYNEQMIPCLDMRSVFNLKGSYPKVVKTIIIKNGGKYLAILSDEILGEQQAVLKPLGQAFDSDSGILAVTQIGNGQWACMLNIQFLFEQLKSDVETTINAY